VAARWRPGGEGAQQPDRGAHLDVASFEVSFITGASPFTANTSHESPSGSDTQTSTWTA
jgi:hypothetical protein